MQLKKIEYSLRITKYYLFSVLLYNREALKQLKVRHCPNGEKGGQTRPYCPNINVGFTLKIQGCIKDFSRDVHIRRNKILYKAYNPQCLIFQKVLYKVRIYLVFITGIYNLWRLKLKNRPYNLCRYIPSMQI